MLSRKYYKMIARVINDSTIINRRNITREIKYIDKDILIDDLCIELKADNYAFNRDTFIKACNE